MHYKCPDCHSCEIGNQIIRICIPICSKQLLGGFCGQSKQESRDKYCQVGIFVEQGWRLFIMYE
ncbi:MAG: methylenetetrahydrofolate reductase C-terminal domain-containing protein [Bacteroidales bacterium]|nr:methylenetetrahydrofolate reductase C-terminal domain-containing protein [Bacteroidales bacterium]